MSSASTRWLLIANATVGLVAGVTLLLLPTTLLSILGLETDPTGANLARLYAAELIGFNLATWLARNAWPPSMPIVRGHIANETLTAAVLVWAAIGGLGNPLVWAFAAVAATFALGYILAARSTR